MTIQSDVEKILQIPLDRIRVDGNQPRKTFNEQRLKELADSIKMVGLLHPIIVKRNDDGTYTVLEGERRFRAHRIAGIPAIKAILGDGTDREISDQRLAENVVREDLSDIELAKEFQRKTDLGQTQEEIAAAIGKSRAFVTQRLSLLRLPEESLRQLEEEKITFTEARALANAPSGPNVRIENQHGYGVTMESKSMIMDVIERLEVYKLFQAIKQAGKTDWDWQTMCEAYEKDLRTLRDAADCPDCDFKLHSKTS